MKTTTNPEITSSSHRLAIFNQCIANGETVRFAEMCALQQAPGTRNTDRAFSEGAHRQMESMSEVNRRGLQKLAKRAGISTDGKFYKGSLGRPTDPAAWVSTADDVLSVARKRNLNVEGVINHKAVDIVQPPKKRTIAPDIVNDLVRRQMTQDESLAHRVRQGKTKINEVREMVIEKHSRKPRQRTR